MTHQELINLFNETMSEASAIVSSHIINGIPDDELINAIVALRYMDPNHLGANYSDRLTGALYFIKYGHAYAFEYAAMFDAVLNCENEKAGENAAHIDSIKPVTFGCGSFISTFSLVFAYSNKKENRRNFRIHQPGTDIGVDLTQWPLTFNQEGMNAELKQMDIVDYIANHFDPSANLLAFTKILNELDSNVVDAIIDAIRNKAQAGAFSGNVYYICISHSLSEYEHNPSVRGIAERIIEAINVNNEFEIDDSIPEYFYQNTVSDDERLKLLPVDPDELCKCYGFVSGDDDKYVSVQKFFGGSFNPAGIDDVTHQLKSHTPEFRAIRTVSQVRMQIIRLTRIEGDNV